MKKIEKLTQSSTPMFNRPPRVKLRTGKPEFGYNGDPSTIKQREEYEARVSDERPLFGNKGPLAKASSYVTIMFYGVGEHNSPVNWKTSVRLVTEVNSATPPNGRLFGMNTVADIMVDSGLGEKLLGKSAGRLMTVRGSEYFPESWPNWLRSDRWVGGMKVLEVISLCN